MALCGGNVLAGTVGCGLFISNTDGVSWDAAVNGLANTSDVYSLLAVGGAALAGTNLGVYRSLDYGTTWQSVDNGIGLQNNFPTYIYAYTFAVSGNTIFAGTNAGVYVTMDRGNSWAPFNVGLSSSGGFVISLTTNGSGVLVGTEFGGIFLSENNGASWEPINNGLGVVGGVDKRVNSLATSGYGVFAGTNSGVFFKANGNASWEPANDGLTTLHILSLAISGSTIFAGTDSGVFISKNNAASWARISDFPGTVYTVAVSVGNLFATTGDVNWRRPLSEVRIENRGPQLVECEPTGFRFLPGSCSGATIEFSLLHREHVSARIYGVSGNEIETLVSSEFAPGYHRLLWNRRATSAGSYILRFQAGSKSYSKKLPILR